VKIWGAEPKVGPSEYGVFKARRLPSREEIAPEDWALVHTVRERITVVDEMLEIDTLDGKKKVILNYTAPVLDDQGAIQGAIVVNLDITSRREAEEQLQHTLDSLRKAFGTTVQVMVSAVESRDPYTAGHQNRSADLARAIATEMGLSQERIDGIRIAGTIHDIGKLSVPAEILSKPTKLTNIEFSLIKEHARKGYEMLKDVESPWPLAEIAYQHHERMDGSGYPRNLKGDYILMEARIMAVADVVESMASHRPYRPALGLNAALEEIENNKGTLYDADAVDACLKLFREKGFQLEGIRF
jgi:HD-GYP domain-containing protein (c-di-GMP phosphodiesterase class II)